MIQKKKTSQNLVAVCQDVVSTEWAGVGGLDLVSWRPRLGRPEGPRWKSVPQTTGPMGYYTHRSLLPGYQADIWEVRYLQLWLLTSCHSVSWLLICLSTWFVFFLSCKYEVRCKQCFYSCQDSIDSSCLPAGRAWQETCLCSSKFCPGGSFLQHIKASDTGNHPAMSFW